MKSMQRTLGLPVFAVVVSVLLGAAVDARAQPAQAAALTVVNADPNGEITSLAEANEVRVIFSEPMVTLGRIPSVVRAPFFRISPAVNGTFRWSGTTILIFTPDPKRPLPFATRYEVTVETTAIAVSGRRLAKPFTFTFTTPTVKLLNTKWYRRGGRADAPAVIALRFNQPIRPADIAAHLTAQFQPHEWFPPSPPAGPDVLSSLDPLAVSRFNAKVATTRTIASAQSPVALRLTNDWDKKQIPTRARFGGPRDRVAGPVRELGEGGARRRAAVARWSGDAVLSTDLHGQGRASLLRRRVRLYARSAIPLFSLERLSKMPADWLRESQGGVDSDPRDEKVTAIGDQEPGSCSVRIHCWKMDARGVINIPFSLSRAVFVMIRLLRADAGSRSCVPAFPQLSLPVPSKSSS